MARTFVQVFPAGAPNTTTTLGPVTVTAGNFGVIVMAGNNNGSTVPTITGNGNVWVPLAISSGNLQMWYCVTLTGGSTTTTFNFVGTTWPFFANYLLEYSGVGASARLDATANGAGNGTSQSVGPITTANIDLTIAALHTQSGSITYIPGGGYTRRGNNANSSSLNAFDLINAAAGSNTFTCTSTGAGFNYQATMVAFSSGTNSRMMVGMGT